jgi:cytosine/adenosine deaminase-related metal-dependent hydrolase
MLRVRGTVVALAPQDPERIETGTVVLGDDGLVSEVTRRADADVTAGRDWVFPGLVDLHSHLGYNTLPLWTDPGQTQPYLHRDIWPGEPSYQPMISWPAWTLARCEPAALLGYVEVKALVGGTTAIQGTPGGSRPLDGWLVRNIDDEAFGGSDRNLLYTSVLTVDDDVLRRRAQTMANGRGFVYHCAEGRPGSVVAREFDAARRTGCLQSRFIAIHLTAVGDFSPWSGDPGAVVWSPFSNLWLYGETTDVPAARRAGVTVCLGSDWAPSGTPNVLAELKVAWLWNREAGWDLTDADLVGMVTANPGDALARSWPHPAGRLVPGGLGDLTVVRRRSDDPWSDLVRATERDIRLVVVGGRARYGLPRHMAAGSATSTSAVSVAGRRRSISVPHPTDPARPWPVQAMRRSLEAVRADPAAALEAAERARLRASAAGAPEPLVLELDMPFGDAPEAGPPRDPSAVVIPPIAALSVTAPWLSSISGRGFHGGVLDDLATFYP